MQDHIPNRNYLAAYAKNLIWAGDKLVESINDLWLASFKASPDNTVKEAIQDWNQAKENLMGLAGRKVRRSEPEGKLDATAEDQARRQGKTAFDAEMAAL